MAYAALTTIQTYNSGDILTAAALQQANSNFEFLIDPPACSVYNSTNQTTTTATVPALAADSEHFDNDSMHSTSSSNSRITVQTPGRYLFIGRVAYVANSTGWRFIEFLVNGTGLHRLTNSRPEPTGTLSTNLSGSATLVLAAGDYVELRAYQSSGGNLDVSLKEFTATYLTR